MDIQDQIRQYLASLPDLKRADMEVLHTWMVDTFKHCRLWFMDGKDAQGKVVSNPNIGYGQMTLKYADGGSREFYQVGISANTSGISVYLLGIQDKKFLAETYGKAIGKAQVTGYCVKFRRLGDIEPDVLKAAIKEGMKRTPDSVF